MSLVGQSFRARHVRVFSLEAIVRELTPVLDETLAGITADS